VGVGDGGRIKVGALAPLSEPGVVAAGQELVAGMKLATELLNAADGPAGKRIELKVVDTRGSPAAGVDAAARLSREGVHVLVGEFHSVVAATVAREAEHLKVPFICASATLDAITAERSRFVFRLAPPQSYGWRIYAEFLVSLKTRHVVAAIRPDIYWTSGAAILESTLARGGAALTEIDVDPLTAAETLVAGLEALSGRNPPPDAVLLLFGYGDRLPAILHALRIARRDLFPGRLLVGDPAGRPALPDWRQLAGVEAHGVPFLAYERPGVRTGVGRAMEAAFELEYGRRPSFVALEGYDAVLAVAAAAALASDDDPEALCAALREVELEGTRDRFRFSTEPTGVVHQQWRWPPVSVLCTSPSGQFDLLREVPLDQAHPT